jgi:hypothetical protein
VTQLRAVPEKEKEFQGAVVEMARLAGWRVAHFRPARTKHGWKTPVSADGAGFPDLILTRNDRLVVAELKSDTGKVSSDQELWLDAFSQIPGVEVFVWRPAEWSEVVETLTGKPLRKEQVA